MSCLSRLPAGQYRALQLPRARPRAVTLQRGFIRSIGFWAETRNGTLHLIELVKATLLLAALADPDPWDGRHGCRDRGGGKSWWAGRMLKAVPAQAA